MSELVYEAAREAHAKNYTHLYVIGFAIQPNARTLIEKRPTKGVTAYVQATPDLMMAICSRICGRARFSACVDSLRSKSPRTGQAVSG